LFKISAFERLLFKSSAFEGLLFKILAFEQKLNYGSKFQPLNDCCSKFQLDFAGLSCATFTPMNDDESVDFVAFKKFLSIQQLTGANVSFYCGDQ
jgi:hypothetical protein